MAKQVRIRIFPNGEIQAETQGVKGPTCTGLMPILEALLNAEIVDSTFKPEYYEDQSAQVVDGNWQMLTDG